MQALNLEDAQKITGETEVSYAQLIVKEFAPGSYSSSFKTLPSSQGANIIMCTRKLPYGEEILKKMVEKEKEHIKENPENQGNQENQEEDIRYYIQIFITSRNNIAKF
jgi:hypothetical protein